MSELSRIDKRAVARAFGAASARYENAAGLQQSVREELLDRLRQLAPTAQSVLDLGCGTGAATVALRRLFPQATLVALDLAHGMLVEAARKVSLFDRLRGRDFARINADAMRLPLADHSMQVVFSSLMLQWCDDLDLALAEIRRVLTPGGLLLFSTFGPGTLQELRSAWASVDDSSHVNDFVDMHDLGAALTRAGFQEPVLDADRLRREYADPQTLMRELKEIGAGNALASRRRGLTTIAQLRAMESRYRQQFSTAHGVLASWEVLYATAFAGTRPAAAEDEAGAREQFIPLASISRRSRP
jgi:malonyl-CoA O-methyltransferase